MLEHEIYDVVIARTKEILKELIVGKIFIIKGNTDIYIWIQHPRFGTFRYTIYDVDKIDWNELSSTTFASLIINWHKNSLLKTAFLSK